MGKQSNKVLKAKRRKRYLKRKNKAAKVKRPKAAAAPVAAGAPA